MLVYRRVPQYNFQLFSKQQMTGKIIFCLVSTESFCPSGSSHFFRGIKTCLTPPTFSSISSFGYSLSHFSMVLLTSFMSSSVGKQFPSISPRVDTLGSACLFNSQAWEKVCGFCWIWLEHGIMFDIYIQHTHTKKIEHTNPTKVGATDSFMCCGFVWFPNTS